MKTPTFLKPNGTIGVVAPSDGLPLKYKSLNDIALKKLTKLGFNIKFSNSCFNSIHGRSNDAIVRAKEFTEMYFDPNIDIVMAIGGGEYELEILKYLDLKKFQKSPKLICGYSDNSVLTFIFLTNLEIVNIYGHNFYELGHNHKVIDNYLETLKGNILPQVEIKDVSKKDYDYFLKKPTESYKIDYKCDWKLYGDNVNVEGIIIGGLLDDLISICGTKYDKVKRFTNKYKKEGFIWMLDICTMEPEEVKRALFQLKNASWFKYAKAILIGRPLFTNDSFGITYQNNMYDELKDLNIPIIMDINLSHIPPSYHVINGKRVRLTYKNSGEIIYLEEEI